MPTSDQQADQRASRGVMRDLTSPRVICFKGWLFLATGAVASAVLLMRRLNWQDAALLAIAVWSFCRFYYFAFYVIQHYVDPDFRYAGLWDFVRRRRWIASTLGATGERRAVRGTTSERDDQ